jgi:hypothetical protein
MSTRRPHGVLAALAAGAAAAAVIAAGRAGAGERRQAGALASLAVLTTGSGASFLAWREIGR